MASYYGDQRQRIGRGTLVKAFFLWLLTLVSSILIGLFFGLACFLVGVALKGVTDVFVTTNEQVFFQIGFYFPVILTFFGPGVFVAFADRIGPWLLGATKLHRNDLTYPNIKDAFDHVSIAAMESPIVYITDAPWHNATSFGKRNGKPVVLLSTACEQLSSKNLQVIAATCLADVYEGKGVSRIWLALRVPAIAIRIIWNVLRRNLSIFLALTAVALLGVAVQTGIGGTIAVMVLFPFLFVFLFGVCLLWLVVISKIGKAITASTHATADIGAIGLLKHPEQWQAAMTYFSHTEFNHDMPAMPKSVENLFEWLLPQNQKQLYVRSQALFKAIPATSFSLDKQAVLLKSLGLDKN